MKFYIATLYDRAEKREDEASLYQYIGITAESEEEAREKLFSEIVRLEFNLLNGDERRHV